MSPANSGETIAETGPGIPDGSAMDGQLRPGEFGAAEADRQARALSARGWTGRGEPVDESEAHPS